MRVHKRTEEEPPAIEEALLSIYFILPFIAYTPVLVNCSNIIIPALLHTCLLA